MPLALSTSAMVAFFLPNQASSSFWITSIIAVMLSLSLKHTTLIRHCGQLALGISLLFVVATHSLLYALQPISLAVNAVLMLIALMLLIICSRSMMEVRKQQGVKNDFSKTTFQKQ